MAAEKPDKKEKKDKMEKKRSEENGVSKPKKDKKEKKDKKVKLATAMDEKLQEDAAAQSGGKTSQVVGYQDDSDMNDDADVKDIPLVRTVVPFAVPLADDKGTKKVYKTIKKGQSPSF